MDLTSLYKRSCELLCDNAEMDLAYLYGVQSANVTLEEGWKTRLQGYALQSFRFFYHLVRFASFSHNAIKASSSLFFYVGTENQRLSLEPIMRELSSLGRSHDVVFYRGVRIEKQVSQNVCLNWRVATVACLIFFSRSWKLYKYLLEHNNKFVAKSFSWNLFLSYVFVPYFLDLLSEATGNLKMVVVANDHNVDTRSLRLVAESLGLSTMYTQHASVSELFPPLQFDYALLDGLVACEIYSAIAKRKQMEERSMIFLTGQKKTLASQVMLEKKNKIGLAVNRTGSASDILTLVKMLMDGANGLVVRYHPNQDTESITELNRLASNTDRLELSDPLKDSLTDFFTRIDCLVAQDSSIHLEAALFGLQTFYYFVENSSITHDYYGFVKEGISIELHINDLMKQRFLARNASNEAALRDRAIRRYSETYLTNWHFREALLSARVIDELLAGGNSFPDFQKSSELGEDVYRLIN